MYNIDEKTIKNIVKKRFTSLVGKSCKRIEVIQKTKDVPDDIKLELVKSIIKELNYETMRGLENDIALFSNGTKINVNLNRPNS